MKIIVYALLLISSLSHSANWSRFITSKNHDDISISFRQMKKGNAWLVEWQVNNNSSNTVEPFLKTRHYLCEDKNTLSFDKTSLGIYLPKTKRHGDLIDQGICPHSTIKWVKIETEISESSDESPDHDKNR